MPAKTPSETMRQLIAAINAGNIDEALSLYHSDAMFLPEPGQTAIGLPAIRATMAGFLTTRPTLTIESHQTYEVGDVALHLTRWSLRNIGPDGSIVHRNGKGAVVLRRQSDGTWAIAVENPWAELVR